MTNTIYVVYGGRDCDGVLYSYKTRFSTLHEYYAWIKESEKFKEGPFWHNRVSEQVWKKRKSWTKDLLGIAIENGHPSKIYV